MQGSRSDLGAARVTTGTYAIAVGTAHNGRDIATVASVGDEPPGASW